MLLLLQNCNNFLQNYFRISWAVKNSINAKRYYFNYVQYSNQKVYNVDAAIKDLAKVNPDLTDEFFDCLYKYSSLPSLYVKPMRFKIEDELRLVFEMPKDVKKFLRITNKGLLDYIKIIN